MPRALLTPPLMYALTFLKVYDELLTDKHWHIPRGMISGSRHGFAQALGNRSFPPAVPRRFLLGWGRAPGLWQMGYKKK